MKPKTKTKLIFHLAIMMLASLCSLLEIARGENYVLTRETYSEKADIEQQLRENHGAGAMIADFDQLKQNIPAGEVAAFCGRIGLEEGRGMFVTRAGKRFWGGQRHYFVGRYNHGAPANFAVHDSHGSLYLGSWYDMNLPILYAPARAAVAAPRYVLTRETYSEKADLAQQLRENHGVGAMIADFDQLKQNIAAGEVAAFCGRIGLEEGRGMYVTRAGKRFWGGQRHYFVGRYSHGAPANFLVHDSHGSLYLGSWHDMNLPILYVTGWSAVAGPHYALTRESYSEKTDFHHLLHENHGIGAMIADFDYLKKNIPAGEVAAFCERIGLEEGRGMFVTREGKRFWDGQRHYFVGRYTNGAPANFLVHDSHGSLYLGSWHDMNLPLLYVTTHAAVAAPHYALTRKTYSEKTDLAQQLRENHGAGAMIADFDQLKRNIPAGEVAAFCGRIGLEEGRGMFVTRAGKRFWDGKRHYFVGRYTNGAPANFLVHDSHGSLCLGSWYDMNLPVLYTTGRGAAEMPPGHHTKP